MVLAELPNGLLVGLAFGLVGVGIWVIGLVVFKYLLSQHTTDPPRPEERS